MGRFKPSFYLMQVGSVYTGLKGDNPFLLILPCPQQCYKCAYECFIVLKMLLCGYVETNPGVKTQELLLQILEGQEALRDEVADIKAKTESFLGYLKSRFLEFEVHMNELKSKTARINDIENAVSSFSTSVESQRRKLVELGDRSRRSNLAVFGIPEDPDETEQDIKLKVIRDTFQQKLGEKCESVG